MMMAAQVKMMTTTTSTAAPPTTAALRIDEEAANATTGTTDDDIESRTDGDAEKRRQLVVDLAKRRVSKSKQMMMKNPTPAPTTCSITGSATSSIPIPVVTPDKDERHATRSARTRRSTARIPVERSIEEVRAKMMMMQDDDADPQILPVSNSAPTAAAAEAPAEASSFGNLTVDVTRPRSDIIPWDERPTGLPEDVPSFDAGESWDGVSRDGPPAPAPPASTASPQTRAASPPVFCTPSPPPAPTNNKCKDKHFFGPDDEPRSRLSTEDTGPTTESSTSNNNNNSPLSTNNKSMSFEDSRGGSGGADSDDAAVRELTPRKVKASSSRKRIATAKASRLRNLLGKPKASTVDDEKRIDDGVSEESIVHDDGGNVASFAHDGGNGTAESVRDDDDDDCQSSEKDHRHDNEKESDVQHSKSDPDDASVADDKASSAVSFAETTTTVGDAGCAGLFSNKSLILEFDRDIFGCMRDATYDADKMNLTSDADEVSDISSLTGRWRRQARAMAEEQRRANALKAKEETRKEKQALSSNPFDCMAMVCGDLKALICEGIEGHHEDDGARVSDTKKQASF